ncbi:hypothetical protein [Hymenobacter sp. HDW8]|uniref:hypothetical protein n=1 Tax=Hymenobacter sp. HDW8 TaxID=2714932 RepID=UPI0014082A28|nr:hypothetical protein [Hymenobacter sp. HDW8]QIL76117.1 hypothetical protein G7064_09805 [Hymenobacter sp. HDW8]
MSLLTLLDEPHLTISYDNRNQWLYTDWVGAQNLRTLQLGCEQIVMHLQAEHCRKILNDNTRLSSIHSQARSWVEQGFLQQLAAAGLEYMAWVYSLDFDSRFSTDLTLLRSTQPVVVGFNDLVAAYAWLEKCEAHPSSLFIGS